MTDAAIQAFIDRWSKSGGAERANYALFLSELCDILEIPHPNPTRPEDDDNDYVFERRVVFINPDSSETFGRIDLYKRGCFVLETKQGIEKQDDERLLSDAASERKKRRLKGHGKRGSTAWNDTLLRARGQAEQYARALTGKETRPPFLVVIDVGHTIDLYAEFTQTGGTYVAFPDPQTNRIKLDELTKPEIRQRLRDVWLSPLSLDPARRSAKVTREIAEKLAELAKSLEADKHDAHDVAQFLMRCLFTMFAEDVGLLGKEENVFRDLLASIEDPEQFKPEVEDLWQKMNTGGYSAYLRKKLLRFNGGLFYDPSALSLNRDQLDLLIEAAGKDWKDVEPAIFGTLLERALDPVERHKLGAHYTPRAYVERLVMPTIIEPIRKEWDAVRTAAILHASEGHRDEAVKELEAFHDKLCDTKVLDPACGSGNFLYVTLEHLKRIEGEVFATYQSIAERQTLLESGHTVDPHQLLGIEINPRAAAIADIVLWIGYLQWHFRTRGNVNPPEPVIKNFKNIECRDALLTWSSREPLLDEDGKPVTHWDGRTTKKHPVTGEEVPDETAREVSYLYTEAKKADWPKADYVVGNPPFVGASLMRQSLGGGYVNALRDIYPEIPESCDFVTVWWHKAAGHARDGKICQFGLITTNSLRQTFNRRVLQSHIEATPCLSIIFAIPDHPWVDTTLGAAVRISMTAGSAGLRSGTLLEVCDERGGEEGVADLQFRASEGVISSSLRIGAPIESAVSLKSNDNLSNPGVKLHGSGFIVTPSQAANLGLGRIKSLDNHIRAYRNGRDLTQSPREVLVVDLFGLTADEVRQRYPEVYQWVYERVKPERDHNSRRSRRENWWLFGETNPKLRNQLLGLSRYIATVETSKHRFFQFMAKEILPDNMLVNIASCDAYILGVLSSRFHVTWALARGGRLGVGNDPRYNKTVCFEPFPFPNATDSQKSRIRELGEQLDAHRKRQQAAHPKLAMTGIYNVLEKLRTGETLTPKDQEIHEQGLVSVLRQIHDDLDAAVADAYGWPNDLTDEQILERLVALNHERAEEERRGIIRYLRPDFQNPSGQKQKAIDVGKPEPDTKPTKKSKAKSTKLTWPKTLSEQAGAVHSALSALPSGASAEEVSKSFGRKNDKRTERIEEILETLAALGKARELDGERYIAM